MNEGSPTLLYHKFEVARKIQKRSRNKCILLFIIIDPETRSYDLVDKTATSVIYNDVVKRALNTKKTRMVATFCSIEDYHTSVVLHDLNRNRLLVFDNLGEKSVLPRMALSIMKPDPPPRIEDMSSCPLTKINDKRSHCAWWVLAFFEYILNHPWGSIKGFQKFITKGTLIENRAQVFIDKYKRKQKVKNNVDNVTKKFAKAMRINL